MNQRNGDWLLQQSTSSRVLLMTVKTCDRKCIYLGKIMLQFPHIHYEGSSSTDPETSDSEGWSTTGSFLHIKCLRLCSVNRTMILSVLTTLYPAFVYMLNGASSIILQCKYTSFEELIWDISSSLAFRRCQPIPLLEVEN